MKGGIASGVVYPRAIARLAREYRFKSIGGTSAGAIAAAMTAAAEYQRRKTGSLNGFDVLHNLPETLGEKDPRAHTQLLRLFQPNQGCHRLFKIMLTALNKNSSLGRVGGVLWGCITTYWIISLLAVAVSIGIGYWTHSWYVGVTALITALVVGLSFAIYRDITRKLVANNFGMCTGLTTRAKQGPALTPWLHTQIQDAAGLKPSDAPLTFGDLWNADGFPPTWIHLADPTKKRSIDLQMFTTNLTHGRPYIFPHTDTKARLFFDPEELANYMPHEVMRWIRVHARRYTKVSPSEPDEEHVGRLLELPEPKDIPILLAARMSLSFPILFSTVPLWAIDFEKVGEQRRFKRCVFSDGGISSNFPMHLFDGLVTTWPTFGVQLEGLLDDRSNRVYLPERYEEGYGDRWNRFDENSNSASRFGGFIGAIVGTMQNWNDNTLSRMPGVRDRVVRVRLSEDEGGMNLNMEDTLIGTVAGYGAEAAEELLKHFGKASDPPSTGWDAQRWTRLDVLINGLKQRLVGLGIALSPNVAHAKPFDQLISESLTSVPPGHSKSLDLDEVKALSAMVESLRKLADDFAKNSKGYSHTPVPEPELRIRPPL
jgi:predicted acylesterase/phospholipase RssA